jgi:hypothetical protein
VAQEAELELDRFLIGLEGRTRVSKFKTEASLQRLQAKIFGKAASKAILTGTLGGLAGAGQTFAMAKGAGVFAKGGAGTSPVAVPATSPTSATLAQGRVSGPFIAR